MFTSLHHCCLHPKSHSYSTFYLTFPPSVFHANNEKPTVLFPHTQLEWFVQVNKSDVSPSHTLLKIFCCLPFVRGKKKKRKTTGPKRCHLNWVPKQGLHTQSNCGFNLPQKRGLSWSLKHFLVSTNEVICKWALSIHQRKMSSSVWDPALFPEG